MTDIQIKYWTLQEGIRHNVQTETQAINELGEGKRHNLITEGQGQQSINESVRHNRATEGIQMIQANASMIQANAATRNAASNAMNAETNRLVGVSQSNLNSARTTQTKISNAVEGYGLPIKAVNSIGSSFEPYVKMGTGITKSLTDIWKVAS